MKLVLTAQQKQELSQALKNKNLPWHLRKRFEIIRLLDAHMPLYRISRYLETDIKVIHRYAAIYQRGGILALFQRKQAGHKVKLSEAQLRMVRQKQAEKRRAGERWTRTNMAHWVQETFGIVITPEWLGTRLQASKRSDEG